MAHQRLWQNSTSSTLGGRRHLAWPLRPSQTSADAPLRASCRAVSLPVMEPAMSANAGLYRGWCSCPKQSLGGELPALQDIYSTRCHRKAKKIIKVLNPPSTGLFSPLPTRRRRQYRSIKAGTKRLKNSFYLQAIRLLNSYQSPAITQ